MERQTATARYAAFISYAHVNEREAAWLHRALESFSAPEGVAIPDGMPTRGRRIAPVFRDREELSTSHSLSTEIVRALEGSTALIVLCSPAAKASHWVGEEIKTFKKLHGDARVFALIVEGEPDEAFPEALLRNVRPDGEYADGYAEPLAADIRPGKDGKKLGFQKLAAGLLETGLDSLRQRELQRERKRLMAITAVSLGGFIVAAGLATAAVLASIRAEKMRVLAETEAETANRTAEFMIDLFEVADPGEARGREVTAKEILDRGVARIEEGLDGEPAVQGALMHTMGRVYTGLGLYGDAAGLLEKSLERKRDAKDGPLEEFATENALAVALYEKGDFDAAGTIYERLEQEIAALEREQGWKPVFADALAGLADIRTRENDFAGAEALNRRAVERMQGAGLQQTEEYARALLGLGLSLVDQGEFDEADRVLAATLELVKALKGGNHFRVANAESAIGNSYYFAGRVADARTHFESALSISRFNLDDRHPELAVAANNVGRINYELGDIGRAYELITEAYAIQSGGIRERHIDTAFLLYSLGELELEFGRIAAARSRFSEALGLVEEEGHRLYGPLLVDLGRVLCEGDEADEGIASIVRGRTALNAHYEANDWRFALADEYEALCRARLGETDRARVLAESAFASFKAARGEEHYFTRRAAKHLAQINVAGE